MSTLVLNIVLHRRATSSCWTTLATTSAAKRLLMDSYGWEDYGGKHYESVYTALYQGWILPQKLT